MLIRLNARYQEANADFISGLAGGDDDAGTDDADASAGEPGAGEGTESPGGSSAAAASGTPGAAPGAGAGGPADNAGRDQVSNLNAALREERAARKALEQRLSQLEESSKPKVEAPKKPDFLEDPAAVVKALEDRLDETDKQRKEREETEAKQRDQQAKAQETWGKVLKSEAEFSATVPDYNDALSHVRGILKAQVKLANPEATDEQIAQHIAIQEAQGAVHILGQGRNPSQVYYDYAKALGYKPKAAAPAQAGQQATLKPDKDSVRTMGSGGGDPIDSDDQEGRKGGLSELAAAHAELKEERKKNARTR